MKKETYYNYNENPLQNRVGDCVVRAISTALNQPWDKTYKELCDLGFELKAMPNDKTTYKTFLERL